MTLNKDNYLYIIIRTFPVDLLILDHICYSIGVSSLCLVGRFYIDFVGETCMYQKSEIEFGLCFNVLMTSCS